MEKFNLEPSSEADDSSNLLDDADAASQESEVTSLGDHRERIGDIINDDPNRNNWGCILNDSLKLPQ